MERELVTTTTRVSATINPYLRPPADNRIDNQSQNNNPTPKDLQNANLGDNMTQSQWRKSSITGCKQKATVFRGPRTCNNRSKAAETEGLAQACKVCKVKEHNKRVKKEIEEIKKFLVI